MSDNEEEEEVEEVEQEGDVVVLGRTRRRRRVLDDSQLEAEEEEEIKKRTRVEETTSPSADGEGDGTTCSICFELYGNSGQHRPCCLKCGHLFGHSCIQRWIRLEKNAGCPNCKRRARLGDVRMIFSTSVKVSDNSDSDHWKNAFESKNSECDDLKLQLAQMRQQLKRLDNQSNQQPSTSTNTGSNETLPLSTTISPMVSKNALSLKLLKTITLTGARALACTNDCLIATCGQPGNIFQPFGLKKIDCVDGNTHQNFPLHSSRPRDCAFCPWNTNLVLSCGEDKQLCVTDIARDTARVIYQYQIAAPAWSCAWITLSRVAIGLQNGRVLLIDLETGQEDDLTKGTGNLGINALHSLPDRRALFVVSGRDCRIYRHMEPHILVSNQGKIVSFCYDDLSGQFCLSFGPTVESPVVHVLYELQWDDDKVTARECGRWRSRSKKQTRLVRNALWTNESGMLMGAVFDEANQILTVGDWARDRMDVVYRLLSSDVTHILRLPSGQGDSDGNRLAVLSETSLGLFHLKC